MPKPYDMRHYISLTEGKISESSTEWPLSMSELKAKYTDDVGDDDLFDQLAQIKYKGYDNKKHQHVYYILVEDEDHDAENPYYITALYVFMNSKAQVQVDVRWEPIASELSTKDALSKFDSL